jgi:hypothetical protein
MLNDLKFYDINVTRKSPGACHLDHPKDRGIINEQADLKREK